MRHLFGLFHDGYMFHQANLRTQGKSLSNSLRLAHTNAPAQASPPM
jgi:hypothetical protein